MQNKRKSRQLKIPDRAAWSGYETDLDVRCLHKLFFGKSIEEVIPHFRCNAIERMDELLYAPRPVFQYYVHAFGQYLMSPDAKGESDSASPFLTLLDARERKDPGSVQQILESLEPYLEIVANGQEYFDAPVDIYGSFPGRVASIREICSQ